MSNPSASQKLRTKPRPDGTDISKYPNMQNWTYRRWAWEFLRRNVKFINACDVVRSKGDKEKQKVAEDYGLRQYKDYKESYYGGMGMPKFSIGSITSWSAINEKQKKKRLSNIKLSFGQVLIRFDLNHAFQDKKALDKQLRLARQRLEAVIEEVSKIKGIAAKPQSSKWRNLRDYIRVLDCRASKRTYPEIGRLIFAREKHLDDDHLLWRVKDHLKYAREISREKYLSFSLLQGKPSRIS